MIVAVEDHSLDAVTFRASLIEWGAQNFRRFPWRFTQDPYHILTAEVMLHRTQARQVAPIYERFIARYPDLEALANATQDELYETLYSLGLRWRIDLMQQMVASLVSGYNGEVPREKADLLSLPGVSDYVASAIRCFVWKLPEALIDTNTVRVVGRVFGLETRDSSRRNARFRELIQALVDPEQPRAYNFAMLDLADAICTRTRLPVCVRCPVQSYCTYGLSPTTPKRSDPDPAA